MAGSFEDIKPTKPVHYGSPEDIDAEAEMREVADSFDKDSKKQDYELEIFMSSDGKHTVKVKPNAPEARAEAMKKAMEVYDYILTRYGTKQAQAAKEYAKENGNGEPKKEEKDCLHARVKFSQSKTEKNPGRWFKSCQLCGGFLGWQS